MFGGIHQSICLDLVLTCIFPIGSTVQVRPALRRISGRDVEFVDGQLEGFDAIVLATGYKSNVPLWLKVLTVLQTFLQFIVENIKV